MALSSITSGLNSAANKIGSLGVNSTSTATTLPSWYDTAQQNLVNNAVSNSGNVPQLQNTVAGQAINQLSGPNNPFTQSQSTLNTIASGAANPWITNPNGTITPNTNTALGGLAASEQQMLAQSLPQIADQAGAGGTSSGQFGSLRSQTARDTAIANANATMNTALNTAALNNQATGVNAATGESQSGAQGTAAETTLGQAQQASPLTATAQLANILGTIQAPTTVTNTTNVSPLSLLNSLSQYASANPGAIGANLINSIGSSLGLSGLGNTTAPTANGINTTVNAPTGGLTDANGNPLQSNPDNSSSSSDNATQ